MARMIRFAALLLAALTLLCVCACKGGSPQGQQGVESALPTGEAAAPELTEAQRERVLMLAAAFLKFGQYDITEGVTMSRIEEMINCVYCTSLDGSEVEGYGRVTAGEADDMLRSVFGSQTLEVVLRTKYDASKDQDYYFMNDYYYVRQIEEDHEYEIASTAPVTDEDGEVIGVRVNVVTKKDGAGDVTLALELADNENGELCVKRCEFYEWN